MSYPVSYTHLDVYKRQQQYHAILITTLEKIKQKEAAGKDYIVIEIIMIVAEMEM